MSYSETILELFSNPYHAGILEGNDVISKSIFSSNPFSNFEFYLRLDGHTIAKMSFQCSSTPILIAVAEYVCRQYEGVQLTSLGSISSQEIIEVLGITPTLSHVVFSVARLLNSFV